MGATASLLSLAPPFGTELELGAERGRYHFESGCGGPHNFVSYSAAQFRARHQWRDGGVIVGEAAGQYGKVTRSIVRDGSAGQGALDDTRHAVLLAVRAGYHGRHGGFEIGPAYFRTSGDDFAFFSANTWVGSYAAAHLWASMFGQQTLSLNRLAGVGLGHASDSLRLSLGRSLSAGQDGAFIFDFDYRVTQRLWVGTGTQWGDTNDTWAGMLRLGAFFPGDTENE